MRTTLTIDEDMAVQLKRLLRERDTHMKDLINDALAILRYPGIRANLIHDAHLAALAIEHGLTLCSTDGDFARFRELKWQNPLAP